MSAKAVCGIAKISGKDMAGNYKVFGRVEGRLSVGDEINVTNFGCDDKKVVKSTIISMIDGGSDVFIAENCSLEITISNDDGCLDSEGSKLRVGSVIYNDDASLEDIHKEYVTAINDGYFRYNTAFTIEDMEDFSIADCSQILSVLIYNINKVFPKDDKLSEADKKAAIESSSKKRNALKVVLTHKIVSSKSIFVLYNTKTNHPHLFTGVFETPDKGSMLVPPEFMVIPAAYVELFKMKNNIEDTEYREIKCPEGSNGIISFLGDRFYIDGAAGIFVVSRNVELAAEKIVAKPEFLVTGSNVVSDEARKDIRAQVNPEAVCFMCILTQLGNPLTLEKDSDKLIYNNVSVFLARALVGSKVLVKVKKDENSSAFLLPTVDGKNGKKAVIAYTDITHMPKEEGAQITVLSEELENILSQYDCIIDRNSESPSLGIYLSMDTYKKMKKDLGRS